jgi:hypothetical protein
MAGKHEVDATGRATSLTLKKKLVFAAIPVTVVLLLGLETAEVWLRMKFEKIERITGVADWEVASYKGLTYFWDTYHPLYGWTNLPGYRSDAKVPFRVTINGQGLRADRDYPPQANPGIKRIAVLGDSCTFGEEVNDDQTLPYHLERSLSGAEVLNFGVHGFGLGEMTLRLDEVFAFHPDMVLVVITVPSDLGRTVLTRFVHAKPAFTVDRGRLEMLNTPVPVSAKMPWLYRHSFTAAWLFARPNPLASRYQAEESKSLLVSRALLERIKQTCKRQSTPLMVVLIAGPDWIKSGEASTAGAVIDQCRRMVGSAGLTVSDQVPFLREMQARETGIASSTGIHWSGLGNCLLAESLARDLSAKIPGYALAEDPACSSQAGR